MTSGPVPSPGQSQAISELRGLELVTRGVVKLVQVHDREGEGDYLPIDLLVDCGAPEDWTPLTRLEPAERVTVQVPPAYPLRRPYVTVDHDRFTGLPHVVWGEMICLHLSDNDWDPGRGMHGLVERLLDWFRKAADGTLAAAEVVAEPPLTDTSAGHLALVVRPELPAVLEADPEPWTAWAVIEAVGNDRYEVRRWVTDLDAETPDTGPADTGPADTGPADTGPDGTAPSDSTFLAVVLGLPDPVGFSFPQRLGDLVRGLERQRVDPNRLHRAVEGAVESTGKTWTATPRPDARPHLMVLLVSPSPPRTRHPSRVAYLAGWTVSGNSDGGGDGDLDWDEPVHWIFLIDQRPRFVTRRDATRPTTWLRNRRVLLLGCGGLGAPIADFCVRAGVSDLHLVDRGWVLPGILVRQPFADFTVGMPKVFALAAGLEMIGADASITPLHGDAVDFLLAGTDVPEADLIIDATAARTVAAALERTRWERKQSATPLLSVMVGHDCARGVATLALPGANGAGVDILRRLAVTASADDTLADVLDDFHPDLPRTELFVPEPGCSDPTYVGSAADLAAFAGWLLNDALTVLRAEPPRPAPLRWATVMRSPAAGVPDTGAQRRYWQEPLVTADDVHHYQVRLDASAFADVRREVLRTAGRRGPAVETGGLLLGQIDHASRVVWVTEAQGLPEGSVAAAEGLRLDPRSAREAVADRLFRTRRLVGFIGAWHTHPRLAAIPSSVDHEAMEEMAREHGVPVLLMIFGAADRNRWDRWVGGHGRPDWYAGLYFPPTNA